MPISRNEPNWLPLDLVIDTAQDVVAATGEPFGLRDAGLLEGALSRPQNHWEYSEQDDVLTLAIIYLLAIARAHPFIQGNKRTAFICAELFLQANGYDLALQDSPILGEILERLITGDIAEEDFHLAVQDHVREQAEQTDTKVALAT